VPVGACSPEAIMARLIEERVTVTMTNQELEIFAVIGSELGLSVEESIRRLAHIGARMYLEQQDDDGGSGVFNPLGSAGLRQRRRKRR
jgi:hypothetical protein